MDPQVGFAVDVTHALSPGCEKKQVGDIALGKGPTIARGPNFNAKLFTLVRSVAKKHGIKCQIEAEPRGTGTDADALQLTRAGVPTALISIPLRYMHTPVEMFDLRDIEAAVKLIGETIVMLDHASDFVL